MASTFTRRNGVSIRLVHLSGTIKLTQDSHASRRGVPSNELEQKGVRTPCTRRQDKRNDICSCRCADNNEENGRHYHWERKRSDYSPPWQPGNRQNINSREVYIHEFKEYETLHDSDQQSFSVAEIAEKPLYRVTCGDIGTNAADVEKYLQSVMYLGKIWDCGMYNASLPSHHPC